MSPQPRDPGVFLDRDDTLIDTTGATAREALPGDLADPDLVRLLPGVERACRRLADAGLLLVGISNQGSIARGTATVDDVHRVNQRLLHLLPAPSAHDVPTVGRSFVTIPDRPSLIAAIYFCPYHPDGDVPDFTRDHDWRKPAPGMVLAAAEDLDIDLDRSWMVGNAARDIECALNAGLAPDRALRVGPDSARPGLLDAAEHILRTGTSDA